MNLRTGAAENARWWLPGVLAVETLLFLPALIAQGIIRPPLPKYSESTNLFYAWGLFWRDEVLAGRAPFWNPYTHAGMPIGAEPQAHTFYPGHLLWLVFPPEFAFTFSFLVHLWIGSWLMYRLARELGASRAGASLSALAYGLQGQMIGFVYAGWIHQVMPMAWAPGVIWMFCRALRSQRRWPLADIAGAAMFLGIQITSGHPEWVRYTLYMLAILTIGSVPGRNQAPRRRFGNRVAIGMATVLLGLVIGGVQLVPTIQAARHSARGQQAVARGEVRRGAGLPLASLPTVIAPRLFGPWDQTLSVDGLVHKLSGSGISYSESLIYVGVLPLLLGVLAWRHRRETGATIWAVVALAGLLLALNDRTHLLSLIDRVVTLDATFRSPGRFVFLTNFALAVLAGLGLTQLGRSAVGGDTVRRYAFVLSGIFGAGSLLVWIAGPSILELVLSRVDVPASIAANAAVAADGGRLLGRWAIANAVREGMTAALILLLAGFLVRGRWVLIGILVFTAAELSRFAAPLLTSVVPAERVYARDAALLAPVAGNPAVRVTARALGAFEAGDNVTMVFRVRSVIGYDSFSLAEWDRLWSVVAAAPPEQLAVAGVTHVVTTNAAGAVALAPVRNARGHVWWSDRVDLSLPAAAGLAADPRAAVAITRDEPGRLTATIDSPSAGWLVLTEVWYPGWTARVNGTAAPVSRAFEVFQAVPVPAGRASVEFAFRPVIIWWGAACTAAGLLVAIALAWRRRESRPPAGRP